MTRAWELVVAAVEIVCGAGVGVYLVVLGLSAEGSDRVSPFVLAALAVAVLGTMAWRSVRRARTAPDDRGGFPDGERQRGRQADTHRTTGARTTPATTPAPPLEPPELSEPGRLELARIVGVLADAGVLAPTAPDPDDLAEATADAGGPVTAGTVLGALQEADFWHPGFDTGAHTANLAFHDSHVEQFADTLTEQVDDLARLAGETVRLDRVEVSDDGEHRLRLHLADGTHDLAYRGHLKYLSTVLHVTIARAASVRLAWLWVDQGVWITALRSTTVDELNARLAAPEHEGWTWVDEAEPLVAG